MTQMGTDHHRLHRDIPSQPGQCFSLDAYSHTSKSFRRYKFCDLFTDLATRCVYPVFTKDRSAKELCEQTNKLFKQHPEWSFLNDNSTRRFFRLDAENKYRSELFRDFSHSTGYALERTSVRDKHANDVAERSVGIITAKTNVAMLTPDTQVPPMFWDYAMAYTSVTHSFNFSLVLGTFPYTKVTGQSIDIRWLQPFFASCYVFIPLKDRGSLGHKRAYKAKSVGYANTHLMFPNYFVIPFENGHYSKIRESKDVIFDPTKDFKIYTEDEEPYDREFVNTEHYIPFLHRKSAPVDLQEPQASPHVEEPEETLPPDFPKGSPILAPPDEVIQPIPSDDTNASNINKVHETSI